MKPKRIAMLCALAFGAGSSAFAGSVFAQATMDQMKKQMDELQRQMQQLKDEMDKMQAQQKAAPPAPPPAAAAAPAGHEFLERKPTDDITFYTRGGEINLYGNLDLSLDYTTKGINGMVAPDGSTPAGNRSWMGAISSNLSYLGVRGFQTLGEGVPFNFVYQLETEIALSATSGTTETNSNTSNVVKGGAHLAEQLHRSAGERLGRGQDRQDRRPLQDLHVADESIPGDDRRLRRDHG